MAMALAFITLPAAEPKQPSLMGASRQQVLAQLGEPKSNIAAGSREVLFFARERVVLRDNVVIEVEHLPAEAPRRPPPVPAEVPAATVAPAPAPSSAAAAPAANETVAPPAEASATATKASVAIVPPPPAIFEADAPLVIKSVRPAGAASSRVAPINQASVSAPPAAVKPEPVPTPMPAKAEGRAQSAVAPAESTASVASNPRPGGAGTSPAVASSAVPVADVSAPADATATSRELTPAPAEAAPTEDPATPAVTKGKKGKAPVPRRPRGNVDLPEPDESVFTARTYVIAFIVIFGGAGFLVWRRQQRQLELAATSVSRTPFLAAATTATGARFTAELLGKLEWKRFEELVAAYYSKTGVVAVRTKGGPQSAVHIKISWKGEPRPFACVQCISRPSGLVDAKPLQDLFAVIAAEDIRRGYLVTTGKFNVPARDFSEEKHLTLLTGDLLLEKLNALPDMARNELMQEITTGDYTTPSCPKCEARMVHSPEDPSAWRCSAHPDITLPV